MHPSGAMNRDERLEGIMGDDGITNCGNAQNCVKACPMNIPLTKAIYEENRETVIHALLGWLKKQLILSGGCESGKVTSDSSIFNKSQLTSINN